LADSYRKDILEACSKNINPLLDLCDFVQRVRFVSELIDKDNFAPIVESANRVCRILKDDVNVPVDASFFAIDAEADLYEKIKHIKVVTYEKLYAGLQDANPAIEKFFEDVLVMDKDEKIKTNRLAMLTLLKNKYKLIADFSALQM